MRLKIQQIALENFKAQRDFQIKLQDITRIFGRNRSGKTTIADAITWCLFGKDSRGRTQFALKTRDNGIEIPHLDHSVTLHITVDDVEHVIQRTLQEKWVKPHGETETVLTGHNTLYFVDGEKLSQRDFAAFISGIVNEETFRALTTPSHFPSLDWKTQRSILTKICGDVTTDDVIARNPSFAPLKDILKTKSITQHLEHLSYLRKEVMKTLDQIPVRISELTTQMPEQQDWDNADAELEQAQRNIRMGGGEVQNKLDFARRRKDNIIQSAQFKATQLLSDFESSKQKIQAEIARLTNDNHSLENKIKSLDTFIQRCNQTLEDSEQQKLTIRQLWAENGKSFSLNDDDTICPICHQPLPQSILEEKVESLHADFNRRKAETYQRLTEQANQLKTLIAATQEQIQQYTDEQEQCRAKIEGNNALAEQKQEELNTLTPPDTSTEAILAADKNYQDILQEIKHLETLTTDTSEDEREAKRLQALIAQRDQFHKFKQRIAQLEQQQQDLNKQLSEIEQQQDLARDFQQLQGDLLEQKANSLFSFVRFRLFRQLINGSTEPYCEATVNGIPYADLNSADKINAGIDIINTLSSYYKVSVPLVIDNAESINTILESNGQQIQLFVSEDPTLTIR